MVKETTGPDILSITVDDRLEVTLDFGGDNDKKSQFIQYAGIYDITDTGTLLNLQHWARTRNIPCSVKVHKYFSIWSWAVRLFLLLDKQLEKSGQSPVRPQKWRNR